MSNKAVKGHQSWSTVVPPVGQVRVVLLEVLLPGLHHPDGNKLESLKINNVGECT